MAPSHFLCLLAFLCWVWNCDGVLVTKNMNKPRVMNLEAIGDPGKEVHERLNLAKSTAPLPPIVCIPGVGGCQLSAKVNKSQSDHWYCRSSADWYLIWLSLEQLLPGPTLECWSDNFMLNYTNSTGFTNTTGVDIMADHFNSTLGFEYVDPSVPSQTIYFASLVASLLKVGYLRGSNLFGAPYDWRLSPNYLPHFMKAFQLIVENAYATNNNTRVAIIAHSMGNLFFLSFLRTVTQEWKDKYVLTYIASSPPWVGSPVAVQALTSGYDFSIPYLSPSAAKAVQRTFASNYFLLPYPKFYQGEIFVSTSSKNYTSLNYQDLFSDLGISAMYPVWSQTLGLVNPYEPPGVDTYCLYGYNVTTVKREVFATNDMAKQPKMVMGDGDGTVPIESLTFCNYWAGSTKKKLVIQGYKGQEHVNLLLYPPFIQDVISGILNATST